MEARRPQGLALEVIKYPFDCILVVKASPKVNPDLRGREIDFIDGRNSKITLERCGHREL